MPMWVGTEWAAQVLQNRCGQKVGSYTKFLLFTAFWLYSSSRRFWFTSRGVWVLLWQVLAGALPQTQPEASPV